MTSLKVGTRGSTLALRQTAWVCERLSAINPSLDIEQVVIKTHGDLAPNQRIDDSWPVGAFVSALEGALLEERIDFAVHSYKDLQTASTSGLNIAAVPTREAVHDVLLTSKPIELSRISPGARIGTSSPRRAAQMRLLADVQIVPIRGNVPTRVDKLKNEDLDGVILAAAGLRRLGISHANWIDLPIEVFVPAPGQGALAVQVRTESEAARIVTALDDGPSRRCVDAERSFLTGINAGCHSPTGALATDDGSSVTLTARLFSEDHERHVDGQESGNDPTRVGLALAGRLSRELESSA